MTKKGVGNEGNAPCMSTPTVGGTEVDSHFRALTAGKCPSAALPFWKCCQKVPETLVIVVAESMFNK